MKLGKHKRWLSAALAIGMVLTMNISAMAAPEETGAETETAPEAVTEIEQKVNNDIEVKSEEQGITTYVEEIDPDKGKIIVSKTFNGVTEEAISQLNNFQIQVSDGTTTYSLDKSNTKSQNGLTWKWEIPSADVGKYQVTESEEGAKIPGYSLVTSGTGSVEVKPGTFTVNSKIETTCSHTNWDVKIDGDTNVLFAAALTGNSGCIVISKNRLTESERLRLTEVLTNKPFGGNWSTPVNFYSIEENENGPYTIEGKELHYNPATQEIILHAESDWSHVAKLDYSITAASSPDIEITNDYTPLTTSVDIEKLITGNIGDRGDKFSFTVTCSEPMAEGEYKLTNENKTATFTLGHKENVVLNGVKLGSTLTIVENDATGYTTTIKVGNTTLVDGEYEVPLDKNDPIHIIVENYKQGSIETGITLDSLPYILILLLVAAGVVVFMRRRRFHNGN